MDKLRLSSKERARAELLSQVLKSSISLVKASELLGVSYRQMLRIWERYKSEGISGLKHGHRDHASDRCGSSGVCAGVVPGEVRRFRSDVGGGVLWKTGWRDSE